MKRILTTVILWQIFLGILVVAIVFFTPFGKSWLSVSAGAFTALASSMPAWFVIRRMPTVIKGRDFFTAMVICEAGKWLLTAMMIILFVHYFPAVGIVIGFAITYLGSYLGTFLMK